MKATSKALFVFLTLLATVAPAQLGAESVKDLNTPRDFPSIATAAQWQARAKQVREQALVSCGLWPMP